MFTRRITQYPFKSRFLGKITFRIIVLLESILRGKPNFASYVAYIAEKP
jgi:hypothetical protein